MPSDMLSINADPTFCTSQFKALRPTNSLTGRHLHVSVCFKGEPYKATSAALPNQLVAQLFTSLMVSSYKYTAISESVLPEGNTVLVHCFLIFIDSYKKVSQYSVQNTVTLISQCIPQQSNSIFILLFSTCLYAKLQF